MTNVACVSIALLCVSLSNFVTAQHSHVPVFMWNIDTNIKVNPLKTLDSAALVDQLAPLLERKLVVIFLQDELNVEDFNLEGFSKLKNTVESSNQGVFYSPSVAHPEKISQQLQAKGFQLVQIETHQDLPAKATYEKTALLIELPQTWTQESRDESVLLNGNIITKIYDLLKSKQPDVVGILTAKKNFQRIERRVRIARAADSGKDVNEVAGDVGLCNATNGQMFLYIEKPPTLKRNNKTFLLNQQPDCTQSYTVDNKEAVLVLSYNGIEDLEAAMIKLTLAENAGYWYLKEASISLKISGQEENFEKLKVADIFAPMRFSYHCTPKTNLISENGTNSQVSLEMNGFQLQPFGITNDKFGNWYDCQGFFTEAIWAGILIGLLIALVLAWAISMLADVRTPDRFDDPKGKTITISATD